MDKTKEELSAEEKIAKVLEYINELIYNDIDMYSPICDEMREDIVDPALKDIETLLREYIK